MTETPKPPRAPSGLDSRGRRLWSDVTGAFDLEPHELRLLHEACRTCDRLDDLEAVVTREGVTATGSTGQVVVHPAVQEARQQRATLTRLLGALDLPVEDDRSEADRRVSDMARHAAQTRWAGRRTKGA